MNPVVLNVEVPDRAQMDGGVSGRLRRHNSPRPRRPGPVDDPEHRAGLREALGFAIKGSLVAAGRTPDPYRGLAIPGGQVFLAPVPGPKTAAWGASSSRSR